MVLPESQTDTGFYYDGLTSQRQIVRLRPSFDSLVLLDDSQKILRRVHWGDLTQMPLASHNGEVHFALAGDPPAELIVTKEAFIKLKAAHRTGFRTQEAFSPVLLIKILVICLVLIAVSFVAVRFGSPWLARSLPAALEANLGASARASLFAEMPPCATPEAIAALQNMTDNLLRANNLSPKVTVHLVRSQQPNAFALPDRQIVITNGLLHIMKADPQLLSAVIAHELGHITQHHAVEGLISSVGFQIMVLAVTGHSGLSNSLGNLSATLINMGYSREQESEADRLGASYLSKAGLSPLTLAVALSHLEQANKFRDMRDTKTIQYFSSHPHTTTRLKAIGYTDQPPAYQPIVERGLLVKDPASCP